MAKVWLDFNRQISATRQQFFEEQNPDVMLDALVRESWQRCQTMGLGHLEYLDFLPVSSQQLNHLLEQDQALVAAFSDVLPGFQQQIETAGYLVVLTNASGIALQIQGDLRRHDVATQHTFRPGISFAEECIGTNAMGCAINARREVSILGGEHYVESITGFQCAAAPVLDRQGRVLGVVDLSRCAERPDYGAKQIARQIARQVERRLFFQQRSYMALELNLVQLPVGVNTQHSDGLLLAFNAQGVLTTACHQAQSWLELHRIKGDVSFEAIFEQSFAQLMLNRKADLHRLRLHSGLDISARLYPGSSGVVVSGCDIGARHRPQPEMGDPALIRLLVRGGTALQADLPVMVSGETGTGKEVMARQLYQESALPGRFIALNCAAIPESLIESELFGYEEGAFTGARKGGARGKIEQADKGVLFLDEIGDMPLALQARLLRVLETGEVTRLGGERNRFCDFRLITASHRNLQQAVHEGQFREDLYYRIKGLNLHLLPLRQRPNLRQLILSLAKTYLPTAQLSEAALAQLCAYAWPGNVRELINVLKVLRVFNEGVSEIGVTALPDEIRQQRAVPRHGRLLDQECQMICEVLRQCKGQVEIAAKQLGLGRATLYRKIQRYGLDIRDFR